MLNKIKLHIIKHTGTTQPRSNEHCVNKLTHKKRWTVYAVLMSIQTKSIFKTQKTMIWHRILFARPARTPTKMRHAMSHQMPHSRSRKKKKVRNKQVSLPRRPLYSRIVYQSLSAQFVAFSSDGPTNANLCTVLIEAEEQSEKTARVRDRPVPKIQCLCGFGRAAAYPCAACHPAYLDVGIGQKPCAPKSYVANVHLFVSRPK